MLHSYIVLFVLIILLTGLQIDQAKYAEIHSELAGGFHQPLSTRSFHGQSRWPWSSVCTARSRCFCSCMCPTYLLYHAFMLSLVRSDFNVSILIMMVLQPCSFINLRVQLVDWLHKKRIWRLLNQLELLENLIPTG